MAIDLNERSTKFELLKRSLGLRHKLKVHESIEAPKSHDDLANYLLAKWELEDELHAIENVLSEVRIHSTLEWKKRIESLGAGAIHVKAAIEENGNVIDSFASKEASNVASKAATTTSNKTKRKSNIHSADL